jgi:hypothetical protein
MRWIAGQARRGEGVIPAVFEAEYNSLGISGPTLAGRNLARSNLIGAEPDLISTQ